MRKLKYHFHFQFPLNMTFINIKVENMLKAANLVKRVVESYTGLLYTALLWKSMIATYIHRDVVITAYDSFSCSSFLIRLQHITQSLVLHPAGYCCVRGE